MRDDEDTVYDITLKDAATHADAMIERKRRDKGTMAEGELESWGLIRKFITAAELHDLDRTLDYLYDYCAELEETEGRGAYARGFRRSATRMLKYLEEHTVETA